MKLIKKVTHYWFVFVSLLSFLAGWGMLAHSLKPIQSVQTYTSNLVALPTLAPLNLSGTTGNTSNSGLNLIVPSSSNGSTSSFPLLRSGGS